MDGAAAAGEAADGAARKSCPHTSQNRPSRGVWHSGHGSPVTVGSGAAGSDVDGAGAADAGGEIAAPHSSQ